MIIKTWEIRSKFDPTLIRTVSGAADKQQAWGKFVTRYYHGSPLKPSAADWEVVCVNEREV